MDQAVVDLKRSKIAENTLFLTIRGGGSALLALVQLSFISRFLEGDSFGLFVALRGFAMLMATLMLIGLPQVLIRFLPSYQGRGERGRAIWLFLCSTMIVLVIGSLFCLRGDLLESLMPRSIRALVQNSNVIYAATLAAMALSLKMLLYGAFSGLREMKMQMILEIAYQLFLTAYIVVKRGGLGVALLFWVIFILNAAAFLVGLPVFIHRARRLISGTRASEGEGIILPSILPYWLSSILLSVVALAFTDVDRFVMTSVLSLSAISLFHVASRISALLKKILGMPIIAAQPEITRIYEAGRWDELVVKIGIFTKGTVVATLFLSGLVAVVGRDSIAVIAGPLFSEAYRVLLILLITVPFAAVVAPLLATMRSLHYMRWAVLCDFLWMAVYFGTFFIFVSLWGVMGMAVAQVAATTVQMIASVVLSKREGFYGGVGSSLGVVLLAFVVAVPIGIILTGRFGTPASAACILISPFLGRFLLDKLGVFETWEKEQIINLIPTTGRRAVAWVLSMGDIE